MKVSPLFFVAASVQVVHTYAQLTTSTASHLGDEERRVQENSMSMAESLMEFGGKGMGAGFGGKSGKGGKCAIEAMNNFAFISDVDAYLQGPTTGYDGTFRTTFSFYTPPDNDSGGRPKTGSMQVNFCKASSRPKMNGSWLATQTGFPINGILPFLMVRSAHDAEYMEEYDAKGSSSNGVNDVMMGQYNCNTNEIWVGAGKGESKGSGFGMGAPARGYYIGDLEDHYSTEWNNDCFDLDRSVTLPLFRNGGSKSSKGGHSKY